MHCGQCDHSNSINSMHSIHIAQCAQFAQGEQYSQCAQMFTQLLVADYHSMFIFLYLIICLLVCFKQATLRCYLHL